MQAFSFDGLRNLHRLQQVPRQDLQSRMSDPLWLHLHCSLRNMFGQSGMSRCYFRRTKEPEPNLLQQLLRQDAQSHMSDPLCLLSHRRCKAVLRFPAVIDRVLLAHPLLSLTSFGVCRRAWSEAYLCWTEKPCVACLPLLPQARQRKSPADAVWT